MIMNDTAARIEAAKRAVTAQTGLLHREFGRAESRWKSDGTRVTAVDVAISENIFRELGAQYPDDQYFSEELADSGEPIPVTARYSWVLDPIDGTNNFALGIPHCAISLALLEGGEPVYGVVYDLSRRVLMHGGPGFGMFDGDRPAHVSTASPNAETLIGFHSPSDKTLAQTLASTNKTFPAILLALPTPKLTTTAPLVAPLVDVMIVVVVLLVAVAIVPGTGVAGPRLRARDTRLSAKTPRMSRIASRARLAAQRSRAISQQTGF